MPGTSSVKKKAAQTLSLDKPLPPPITEGSQITPPAPRIVQALKVFEEEVGGREALVNEITAAAQQLAPREQMALALLADPQNDTRQLSDILGTAGLSVSSFLRLFREARGARAYLEALDAVWNRLPEVALDVISRALPARRQCRTCRGSRYLSIPGRHNKKAPDPDPAQDKKVVCTNCNGEGEVTEEPTLDYHKLALQVGGLLKNAPTIQVDASRVQQNLQQNFLSINDTMRSHIAATNRVLYGDSPVIDAEPVEPQE